MNEEEIKNALLKKALGYESDEIVEEYTTDENGNSILSKRKITKKASRGRCFFRFAMYRIKG